MSVIEFAPLEIDACRVRVAWTLQPSTPLYKQNHFTLEFDDALDPRLLPLKMWWTLVLLILHSHWNLLRPCRIRLPVKLPDGEIEFWQRLLDNERVTLEKYRGTIEFARTIEIDTRGEMLTDMALPPANSRYATSFSGGKESLLQTGLLCELTSRPLLVTTYSPLPPLLDHDIDYRAVTLREIVKRRACELVQVESDVRSIWWNDFPREIGYPQTVNEITDTFIYSAHTLAVALGRGIRNITLAVEISDELTSLYHGEIAQDFYFMYAPITLMAFQCLLGAHGITFTSLLSALSQFQIEQLLLTRYPDLAELQISCYSMRTRHERYCGVCRKCERIALYYLATERDPASIGLDLDRVFAKSDAAPRLPGNYGTGRYYAAARIPLRAVRKFFRAHNLLERWGIRKPRAFRNLEIYQRRYAALAGTWNGQYRPTHARFLAPELRAALDSLYRATWELDTLDRSEELARVDRAVAWITAPLAQVSA